MKSRGIAFRPEMIHALLRGDKDVTRRTKGLSIINQDPDQWVFNKVEKDINEDSWFFFNNIGTIQFKIKCPYGEPGDELYVKETYLYCLEDRFLEGFNSRFVYRASVHEDWFLSLKEEFPKYKWTPGMFMKRSAARIRLEIVSIRPERLNDITNEDSIREGIERDGEGWKCYKTYHSGKYKGEPHPFNAIPMREPRFSYVELWDEINGHGSFERNPWVWRIEFKITHVER